jgi:chromosome partitioning protein
VDTPPHAATDAKLAIRAADLVLMPLPPSPADLWASTATVRLAAEVRRPIAVVLNRVSRTAVCASRSACLKAGDMPLLEPTIGNRIGFAQAFQQGFAVTEAALRGLAAQEVGALRAAIRALAAGIDRR